MSRSSKKGPFVDKKLVKKVVMAGDSRKPIKTWARASTISPEMIGNTLEIHNGRSFIPILVNENMVGHKVGEFAPTRRFTGHSQKK